VACRAGRARNRCGAGAAGRRGRRTARRWPASAAVAGVPGTPRPDPAARRRRFAAFRTARNLTRPHLALGHAAPATRHAPTERPFPKDPPATEYAPGDAVRPVHEHGVIPFRNRPRFVGRGLAGLPVAVQPTPGAGVLAVFFRRRQVAAIDLRAESGRTGASPVSPVRTD
jgi:hypothetical protein